VVGHLYNVIFLGSMKGQIPKLVLNVVSTDVINTGAMVFRSFVSPENLSDVLEAYANSIDRTFYLAAALMALRGIFL
jgi:hypothetical protein